MQNFRQSLFYHRYFIIFIAVFAYVDSIYSRLLFGNEINKFTFTPDAAIGALIKTAFLYIILLFFIRKWQKTELLGSKELIKIGFYSILIYLVLNKMTGLIVSISFDTVERNFNKTTFFFSMLMDFLSAFIYGSFFLSYYYFKKSRAYQIQLTNYGEALAESKIHQLKSQLNPHFLFNNLNVLDQLIEEDKHKASDFLNEFSEIYRYVLKASDKKLMPISEELDFIKRYFNLISHKYGIAYQLKLSSKEIEGFIPPMALQLLLENAIKHNLGSEDKPIIISIEIDEAIRVSNYISRKKTPSDTSGKALDNLIEQYKLLSQQTIEIREENTQFIVEIPIIKSSQI